MAKYDAFIFKKKKRMFLGFLSMLLRWYQAEISLELSEYLKIKKIVQYSVQLNVRAVNCGLILWGFLDRNNPRASRHFRRESQRILKESQRKPQLSIMHTFRLVGMYLISESLVVYKNLKRGWQLVPIYLEAGESQISEKKNKKRPQKTRRSYRISTFTAATFSEVFLPANHNKILFIHFWKSDN